MTLEHLLEAELQHQPGMAPLTENGEGALVGSGDGTVAGPRLVGALRGRSSSSRATSSAQ